MATECGFTPAQVREMTLDDLGRISRHWAQHPPLRALVRGVAIALGVEFKPPAGTPGAPKAMTREEFERMVRATGGGARIVGG